MEWRDRVSGWQPHSGRKVGYKAVGRVSGRHVGTGMGRLLGCSEHSGNAPPKGRQGDMGTLGSLCERVLGQW